MKNIFLVIVVIVLSCKEKESTLENKTALMEVAEHKAEIDNANSKTATKEEMDSSSAERTSDETYTNQDYIKSVLYKGTLKGNIKIALYLKEQENSCGGDLTFFVGMYKYDNQDKWILLEISTDRQNKNYCMVEDGFSGVLFLKENEGSFKGNWISTDTKKQFKVELENQLLDTKFAKDYTIIEQLDEILFDDLLYNKNDC